MRTPSFATMVGSTAEVAVTGSGVVVISEPEVGATLRTKGRLYFLCEVSPPGRAGAEIAREVADLARQEYYYDLSAGIEVSLRRALRHANRLAAQRLRDQRGQVTLHCAAAILVNNEIYGSRVGGAYIFLVRRARLFLPGDEPGELADFVHRTTTRNAPSLGAESDLLPPVWRQSAEAGDTLIIASAALVDALGADALKNAVVTLHPRAAAEHLHNRFIAEGAVGGDQALLVEISLAPATAPRLATGAAQLAEPEAARIANSIRSRMAALSSIRPKLGRKVQDVTQPAVTAVVKSVAVGLELMPRHEATLPRSQDTARDRAARRRRLTTALALALVIVAGGIGSVIVRDYQANKVANDYAVLIASAESDVASARGFLSRIPRDAENARTRLSTAGAKLDEAERSPQADPARIGALRAEIAQLHDRAANVVIDLERVAPGSRPTSLAATGNGLYAADPGSGRLWRIFGDPVATGVVLTKGQRGVGSPKAVVAVDLALYSVDDAGKLWRAEGATVADVSPPDRDRWRAVAGISTFGPNLYVLDSAAGQVWKYEADAKGNLPPTSVAFLAQPLSPNTARSISVDGDVWVVTATAEILRYHRTLPAVTAARVDFVPRWEGEAAKPALIQAIESQRFIYVLDAVGKRVIQMGRDGREVARFPLPSTLEEPSAFWVSEGQRTIYTVHGSKIATTEMRG